jgi:hypothetical protein
MKKLLALLGVSALIVVLFGKKIATYALSAEQEAFISALNPVAQPIFRGFIQDITASGWNVMIPEGGGTRPFDNSVYPNGDFHMYGLALDINAVQGTTWLHSTSPVADWQASGIPALAVKRNLAWGGNYTTPDPDHFDMANTYTTAQLYQLSQQQGVNPNNVNLG